MLLNLRFQAEIQYPVLFYAPADFHVTPGYKFKQVPDML